MKKHLIILTGIICLMASMYALPKSFGNLLVKKGTFSYYPELTQLWQPVNPELSRVIMYGNPKDVISRNGYSGNVEAQPQI
jgi:hypothetical protein